MQQFYGYFSDRGRDREDTPQAYKGAAAETRRAERGRGKVPQNREKNRRPLRFSPKLSEKEGAEKRKNRTKSRPRRRRARRIKKRRSGFRRSFEKPLKELAFPRAEFQRGNLSACGKISAPLRKGEHLQMRPEDFQFFFVHGERNLRLRKTVYAPDSRKGNLFLLFDRKYARDTLFALHTPILFGKP